MKTKIFYIVLTAVLSSSTLNVFADGAKSKKVSAVKNNTAVSLIINTVKDAEMEIESWMTSLNEFNGKSEMFIDEPLEMEPWMMNEFNINKNTENFQEDELILEDWMLESFDVKTQEIFIDEELAFEPWMFEIL
jgi:peptidoglycan hydrolase CwlO-like protein